MDIGYKLTKKDVVSMTTVRNKTDIGHKPT